jgi:hypothetical protein
MKSSMTFDQFVHKVISDPQFYQLLKKDPAEALRSVGIELSKEQIEALKEIDYKQLEQIAAEFGPQRFVV